MVTSSGIAGAGLPGSLPTYSIGQLSIFGLNTANQVLIGNGYSGISYDTLVYNFNTGSLTDLAQLMPQIPALRFNNLVPAAIDNSGQILLHAYTGDGFPEALLLTPSGVSPEPLSTPEPGAWALSAMIAGGLDRTARRARVSG